MRRIATDIPQPAIDSGVIAGNDVSCRYLIFQPAVTQWVAIGVLEFDLDTLPVLIVASGENAVQALDSLRRRVVMRAAQHRQRVASPAA